MKISLAPLPLVEGKLPPVHRIMWNDGSFRHEWYYPDPKEDWKDPEIYETDNYRQEDKDEFYDYVTVCKACQTKFIAYKAGEKTMNYCPCCGKQL